MTVPSLGSLPLERYILAQWTSTTETDLHERRRQLARAFVELGNAHRFPYLLSNISQHSPSDRSSILSPLRTEFQRRFASPASFQPEGFPVFGIIWLRTCYDRGSDAAHDALLAKLNIDLALEIPQNVLNDETLYNYGDGWSRIFEVMPERLLNIFETGTEIIDAAREYDIRVGQLRSELVAGRPDASSPQETDDMYRARTETLHFTASINHLFIADKAALESGKALIVFFDDRGRTVRQARIQADLCEDITGAWADGLLLELSEFNEAEIGRDYLPGGVCGV